MRRDMQCPLHKVGLCPSIQCELECDVLNTINHFIPVELKQHFNSLLGWFFFSVKFNQKVPIKGQGRYIREIHAPWEIHKDLGVLVLWFITEECDFPEAEKHSSTGNWLSDFELWRILQDLGDRVRSESILLWNPHLCTMIQYEKITPLCSHCSSFLQQSLETHLLSLLFIHTDHSYLGYWEEGNGNGWGKKRWRYCLIWFGSFHV